MAARVFAGAAAATTLSAGITSGDTTISVAAGSTWPTGSASYVIDRGLAGEEKILATRSGNTLTATRGYDGTTASAHSSGAAIEHCLTAVDLQEANDHVNATGTVHATATVAPTALIIPGATAPAQTAEGSAVWDTDDNLLTIGDGTSRKTLVDTTSTQTLAAKTLTAPAIGDFTNATHTHASAAQGGSAVNIPFAAVRAYTSTTQSFGSGLTVLTWNAENFDTDAFHSGSSGVFTVPAGLAGLYQISAEASVDDLPATTAGAARLLIEVDDASDFLSSTYIVDKTVPYPSSATVVGVSGSTLFRLTVGDNLRVVFSHGQSTTRQVNSSSAPSNFFEMVRLGA